MDDPAYYVYFQIAFFRLAPRVRIGWHDHIPVLRCAVPGKSKACNSMIIPLT